LLEFTGGCDFKGVEITQVWLKDKRYGTRPLGRQGSLSSFFRRLNHSARFSRLCAHAVKAAACAPFRVKLLLP
jgi:hypothetical protein